MRRVSVLRTDVGPGLRCGPRREGTRCSRPAWFGLFVALVTLALGLAAPAVHAQILWDAPRMIGPESPAGLGFYWLRAGGLPDDGDAVFGTWALPGFGGSVLVRGGAGEGAFGETAAFGGVDLRTPLARHTDSQPLDLEWTGGAGVGVGEYLLVSVPMGIAAGRSWSSGSVWFAPYVSAGLALEYRTGDEAPDDDFDVQATAGVGLDLAFDEARRFVLRAAVELADRQALAVGFVLGGGR